MATRPEFAVEANYQNGLAAGVLFVVFAAVFVTSTFPDPVGFPQDASIVAGIGYALFDLTGRSPVETEGFLAAFELVGIVLVAALVAAVMLASHENERVSGMVTALADGGSPANRAGEDGGSPTDADPSAEGGPAEAESTDDTSTDGGAD